MSSTPSAFSAATDRNPIGPPPVTSQRVPGRAPPAWVMPCSATASGSASAACLSERPSGTRSASAARDRLVARRTRPATSPSSPPTRPRSTQSDGRPARQYSHSPHLGDWPADDPVADRPAGHVGAERGDRARELVALDHAGAAAPLDEEVQVGAADPAVADLEQQLARPGLGRGPVLDGDVAQPHEHGRGHGVGNGALMAEGSPEPDTGVNLDPAPISAPTDGRESGLHGSGNAPQLLGAVAGARDSGVLR